MNKTTTNQKTQQNILIVDSDKELKYKIKDYVTVNNIQEKYNLNFIFAENIKEVLKIMQNEKIDLMVLELVLPIINGFYLLNIMDQQKETPLIIYTKLKDSADLKKISEKGNIINIFTKQITPLNELMVKIIEKEDRKSQMDLVISEIEIGMKSLNEDKMETALKVLKCPKCHILLAKNSHFCNNCGQKII